MLSAVINLYNFQHIHTIFYSIFFLLLLLLLLRVLAYRVHINNLYYHYWHYYLSCLSLAASSITTLIRKQSQWTIFFCSALVSALDSVCSIQHSWSLILIYTCVILAYISSVCVHFCDILEQCIYSMWAGLCDIRNRAHTKKQICNSQHAPNFMYSFMK